MQPQMNPNLSTSSNAIILTNIRNNRHIGTLTNRYQHGTIRIERRLFRWLLALGRTNEHQINIQAPDLASAHHVSPADKIPVPKFLFTFVTEINPHMGPCSDPGHHSGGERLPAQVRCLRPSVGPCPS